MSTAKNFSGYTLIELLIGITIISIVFTIGYAGFRQFSRRQALTGVIKMVKADLRQIQQLALTGQKPTTSTCRKLVGYTLQRTNSSTYTINASCDNSLGATPNIVPILIKTVPLTGVTFTMSTSPTLFKVLGQGTNLSAPSVLNFTHTATSRTARITIGTGGDIQ